MELRASEAVKEVVGRELDEAIVEYLAALCISASDDNDMNPLIEAIEDITPPDAQDLTASERARTLMTRFRGEQAIPQETTPAPPLQKQGLSIKATEFKPRSPSVHQHSMAAPSSSSLGYYSSGQVDTTMAAELLSSWFPEYSAADLHLLYESLGNNLWLTVEELQMMEGEEPYAARWGNQGPRARLESNKPGAKAPTLTSDEDFPSLSGSAPMSSVNHHPPQDQGRSVKDALLVRPPAASSSGLQRSSEAATRSTADTFWKGGYSQSGEGPIYKQPVAWLEGSIPVVATGAELTRLYEASRAEARERMEKRAECYRLAAHAYAAGNRSQAQALSREARAHSEAMAEADSRAAAAIYRSRNNFSGSSFVDLHGLHVKEAIKLLTSIIDERRAQRQGGALKVCTGVGKHSDDPRRVKADAQGRLSKAVEALFHRLGVVQFKEMQPGLYSASI
jgi:hypothetical protein